MKTIGTIVKLNREKLGLTRVDLAKKLNVHKGYIAHIENDDPFHVSESMAHSIEKELNIEKAHPISDLIDQNNVQVKNWSRLYRKKAS
jgi:ribosome-binding protein aMBF1 (putative translation factor)